MESNNYRAKKDAVTAPCFSLPCKSLRVSAGGIQQRRCSRIDAHKLPLDLPVRLTHGHQKIHSLSDLPKVRGSERFLMQMLQDAAVSVL